MSSSFKAPPAGKNFLGWGPNVTGLALAGLFFGVYYGSAYWARKWVLQSVDEPERPKYFREVTVTDGFRYAAAHGRKVRPTATDAQ